ncbi:MAG: hypothetical protein IJA77_01135 [Clostridia bacterium]|nr:hypothetical protein [Clostridia bacterium]
MASYTIEDIELIRRKSGISYQEAVSLLDYHNGNVARALVDLERNGRIKPGSESKTKGSTAGKAASSSATTGKAKNGFMELIDKLYKARLKVHKGDTSIVNLSALFCILSVIIAAPLVVVGVICCLVLGYKFSFDSHDSAFDSDNLERMVRSAADNVKSSVSDFAKGFQNGSDAAQAAAQEAAANDGRSFYTARPAAAPTYRPEVPTLNVPVQVESQDGAVTIEGDSEGYTSATIE